MQIDPVLESRRLVEAYRAKGPEELLELARDYADLTEAAQQALRSELQLRGLGDPADPHFGAVVRPQAKPSAVVRTPPSERPLSGGSTMGAGMGFLGGQAPERAADSAHDDEDDGQPREYTWKTPLCACASREEAAQLQEALRRAGVESWVNFDGYTTSYVPPAEYHLTTGLRLLVAADQLDEARALAAQPIPQEIIDSLRAEVPEFVEPECPQCGSDDVVLEGVDPANTWRCEQCGKQWMETLPQAGDESADSA